MMLKNGIEKLAKLSELIRPGAVCMSFQENKIFTGLGEIQWLRFLIKLKVKEKTCSWSSSVKKRFQFPRNIPLSSQSGIQSQDIIEVKNCFSKFQWFSTKEIWLDFKFIKNSLNFYIQKLMIIVKTELVVNPSSAGAVRMEPRNMKSMKNKYSNKDPLKLCWELVKKSKDLFIELRLSLKSKLRLKIQHRSWNFLKTNRLRILIVNWTQDSINQRQMILPLINSRILIQLERSLKLTKSMARFLLTSVWKASLLLRFWRLVTSGIVLNVRSINSQENNWAFIERQKFWFCTWKDLSKKELSRKKRMKP